MVELLRKYMVIPIALLGLSIVFFVLSIILEIAKGNDSILRKKLRIGGLILALQGLAVQGAWPSSSCYERAPPEVVVDSASAETTTLAVDLEQSNTIEAKIRYGEHEKFSFIILAGDRVVQWGAVTPSDQRMNSPEETVVIAIDPSKVSGGTTYSLLIVWGQLAELSSTLQADAVNTIGRYQLIVHGE